MRRGSLARLRAESRSLRRVDAGPGAHQVWIERPEEALVAPHSGWIGLVVSGLFRTRRRLGPCEPQDDRRTDRKSVVSGKRVAGSVDLGGRRINNKKKHDNK